MTVSRFAFAMILGTTWLVGCTPSPEKVCSHFFELEESDSKAKSKGDDERDEKIEKLIKKIREKKKEECPKALGAMKEDSPDAYKCFAKCVMAGKERSDVKTCDKDCSGFREAWTKARKKLAKDEKKGDDDDKKSKKDDD